MADPAVTHLEGARRALQAQKADVERALHDVERLLTQLGSDAVSPNGDSGTDEPIPTVRESILAYLREKPKVPRKVAQIRTNVEARGVMVSDASLRSTLAKMVKAKKIENPHRGFYRLSRDEWPAEF